MRSGAARAFGLRLAAHAASTSDARSGRCRCVLGLTAPSVCAWLLMRLRPPTLDPDGADAFWGCPRLRSAPGCSCGFDLRRSIRTVPMRSGADRAFGLRLAAHA